MIRSAQMSASVRKLLNEWGAENQMDYCLMMELKRKATAARTRNSTYDRSADELEKVFQDTSTALKAEFEEGYSAGYADAWQEIKKIVSNAAFDAEMGAAYGEVV